MKRIIALALALASPAVAQDFSEGSNARSWNLYAEVPATFEAKVVDITCEVTGDCAANCGDGHRQLGLLRSVDGVLVYPNKNSQGGFQGAAADLLPFCEKTVNVDGLILEDEDTGLKNVYQLQLIQEVGAEDWTKANTWTKKWNAKYPEAKGKGPWFRRDPRVNAAIAETGNLGLGLEIDEVFKKELFE